MLVSGSSVETSLQSLNLAEEAMLAFPEDAFEGWQDAAEVQSESISRQSIQLRASHSRARESFLSNRQSFHSERGSYMSNRQSTHS